MLCFFYVCLAIGGPIGFSVGFDPTSEEEDSEDEDQAGWRGCYLVLTCVIPAGVGTVLNWVVGFSGWFFGATDSNCAWAVCVYFATTVVFLTMLLYAYSRRESVDEPAGQIPHPALRPASSQTFRIPVAFSGEADEIAGQLPMNLGEAEEIASFHYSHPSTKRVVRLLQFAGSSVYQEFASVPALEGVLFFLVRAAAQDPKLITIYRRIRDQSSARDRPFVELLLEILHDQRFSAPASEPKSRQSLTRGETGDPLIDELRNRLSGLTDITIHPLERPIRTGEDLDLLWAEFFVSGDVEVVRRIISVLSWPDRIRTRLEDYLAARSSMPLIRRRLRDRAMRAVCEPSYVEIDLERQQVVTQDDLDWAVFKTLGGAELEGLLSRQPFHFSVVELTEIGTKSAARWSLSSNAEQHSIVLDACEAEGHRATGRSRLALLDITASAKFRRQMKS